MDDNRLVKLTGINIITWKVFHLLDPQQLAAKNRLVREATMATAKLTSNPPSSLGNWKYTVTAQMLRLVRADRTKWKESISPVLDLEVGKKMGMK